MKTISIKNKKYQLKYTLRAFFTFENMTGYPFKFGKMIDEYILFYSILIANNETFDMPFDEFISACDELPSLFQEFKNFFLKEIELNMQSAIQSEEKGLKKEEISIRELYARVVGEGGVSPDYFMDKMTFAEVRFFLDGLAQRNRESWEQTRIIGYIMAQANSTKSLKQTDILRFPWDEQEASKDTFVSSEDVDRLRALAKQYES